MKKRGFSWLFILLILFSNSYPVWGEFTSYSVTDELDDGFDYHVFYNDNNKVPAPLFLDAVEAGVTQDGSTLDFYVEFSAPIPNDAPYSLQIALDTDQDTATGSVGPPWYYNGLGVDYLVETEHTEGMSSGGVYQYDSGAWIETGVPSIEVNGTKLTVSVDHSSIGDSMGSNFRVYVIQGIAVDTVPEVDKNPITYIITGEPEEPPIIIDIPLDLVTVIVFDFPELIKEGTPFELDASSNALDSTLTYIYEWDLDGDGVYEVLLDTPVHTHTFANKGDYPVSLRITDSSGESGEVTQIIHVQNTPPYDAEIITPATVEVDEDLTLYATASDIGDDQLTYTWSIDGETLTGDTVITTFDTPGEKTITLTVTDPEGATLQVNDVVTVNEPAEPGIDPLLIILVVFFGIAGFFIYNMIKPKGEVKPNEKKEEEKKTGDFCEEHPEIVEQEEKACWDAQMDLDNAVGDVQDNLNTYRDQWRADIREVSRTIMEWDIAYAMIQSLTQSEEEIRKDAETVQKIAGLVQTGGGMGKTAFKEGGEAAMKEVGKYIASEAGKSIAGGLSSTVNDVLSLETWAYTEIGTGIAKLITGEDPRKEASNIRKESLRTINLLQSWVDDDMARSTRYTSRTLHTCINEAQQLLDALSKAMDDFENAIEGFRCVDCEIPDHILDEIDSMIKELNDFMKTFGDLIDQVEQRLEQAAVLLARKDVYEGPMTWLHAQNNEIPNIQESLQKSTDAKNG